LIRLQQVGLFTLLLWFCAFLNNVNAQSNLSGAEEVAKTYLTAFFHGDMEVAANLTHQDTLEKLKKNILLDLEKAQSEGRVQQFLDEAGIKSSPDKFRQMSAHNLFITLVGDNQKRASAAELQAMKRTVVNVEQSELVNANEVSVRLKILLPADRGTVNQSAILLFAKQGNAWRVKSNLP
jgi:hypothetical protein